MALRFSKLQALLRQRVIVSTLATIAVIAAAAPQILTYADHVRTDTYPGSAYMPRVTAHLKVSRAALQGGPFAAIPSEGRYSLAPGLINDIGVAAIVDTWSRLNHTRATNQTLGSINLVLMILAVTMLGLAIPYPSRLALLPVLLFVPLVVREYRSVDTVAFHGALGALAIALPLLVVRSRHFWLALALGPGLFALQKLRATYGMYANLALIALAALALTRPPRKALLVRLVGCVAAALACEAVWQHALTKRAQDPRVVDQSLPAHNFYEPLISGLGWTENRWGIKFSDPWVATYLAERTGLEPVKIETAESERRARIVYLGFWREAPFYLVGFYLGRIPQAFGAFFVGGLWGGALWLAVLILALFRWRRLDLDARLLTLGPLVILLCLLTQIVMIDPRLMYAYPLRLVSAISLATLCAILIAAWRWRPTPQGAATPKPAPPTAAPQL
ncbi:MAG: hypothetical protein MUF51_00495 [Vicinamibacteria bacterium]|nr:hypothetical protein [Vicinamibacteria bacterium]